MTDRPTPSSWFVVDDGDPARGSRMARPTAIEVVVLLVGALTMLTIAPVFLPDSYSWLEHGTSESAAQGVDGAWVARTGFILFALAVLRVAQLRAVAWGGLGTAMHVAFGLGMLGVATFAHRPWEPGVPYVESEDLLHSICAGIVGFGFIAGVVVVTVACRLPPVRAAIPDLVVLAIACVAPLMMSTDVWGAAQRIMFAAAAWWYAREAVIGERLGWRKGAAR